jgi:Chaperone of endosialidase
MKLRFRMALLCLATFLFPAFLTAAAKESAREPVGHTTISGTSVAFEPTVNTGRILLTVTTPSGVVITKEYAAGRTPSFALQELAKGTSLDGQYHYELRAVARYSDEAKRQLAEARAKDDDAAIERIQREAGGLQPTVQAGVFTVRNGFMVSDQGTEPTGGSSPTPVVAPNAVNAAKPKVGTDDQVIADDLIVQGSACVGLDCVNNESFGFDTIRLKENNLRINFTDTSTSAGFPTNDWQLTANDSASGGQEKFSIDDITNSKTPFTVEGATPTNSLYVDSTGNIGFGTNAPLLRLHQKKGDTPAARFEQDTSSGFTAQTWDIGANEANFFVRDLTGGSRLPFRIRPGAPTSSVDINASGNVGVGTASPAFRMDVKLAASADAVQIGNVTDPGVLLTTNSTNTNSRNWGVFTNSADFGDFVIRSSTTNTGSGYSGPLRLSLTRDGNLGLGGVSTATNPIQHSSGALLTAGGVWTNASSRTFKQDITELDADEAFDTLKGLDPVKYAYKVDPNEHHVGFIAEDVPDLVATADRKGLSSMDIVAVLTKVVQEQQKTIDELKARVEHLEK